jgi:hypothetical protein
MNTFVLTVAAIIVAVLTALFAVPPLIDWNAYRGVFEVEASRLLGRDVRVRGDVALTLLPIPYVAFRDVTVANAPGVTGEPFLRADKLSIRLSAPPLLRGAIEAKQIDVQGARFRLRLDEDGQGNWQDFEGVQERFGLSPTEVSLNSVNFSDVGITLEQADGARVFAIAGISGELAAPRARGPFRFNGQVDGRQVDGQAEAPPLELRVSTGVWDSTGGADVRASLTRAEDKASLLVTGRLDALSRDTPFGFEGRLTGDLAMVLPRAPDAATGARTALGRSGQRIEGVMQISPQRLLIRDLKLDLASAAAPQVLQGEAAWRLAADAPLDVRLRSNLLDADQLGFGADDMTGLQLYRMLLTQLDGLRRTATALGRPTDLSIAVDRLTLGRKSLSGLEVSSRLSDGGASVRRVKFLAPGSTTGFASGRLETGADGVTAFSGAVRIDGRNLKQFADWVWPDAPLAERRAQRPFTLSGGVLASGLEFALTDARVTIGPDVMLGAVSYESIEGGRLDIDLSGPVLDVATISPDLLSTAALKRFFIGADAADVRLPSRATFRLAAGEMRDGERRYRNVTADLDRRSDGAVTVRTLRFETAEGAKIDARGAWQTNGETRAGQMSGRISAADADGASALLVWAEDMASGSGRDQAALALPTLLRGRTFPALDVAFTANFGDEAPEPLRLTAQGRVGRDTVKMEFRSAANDWRLGDHRIALDVAADGPAPLDVVRLARGISPVGGTPQTAPSQAQGRLRWQAQGSPVKGMRTLVNLTAGEASAAFDGEVRRATDADRWDADGRIDLTAASAPELMRALHIDGLAARAHAVPVRATLAVAPDGPATRFEVKQASLGDARVQGDLMLRDATWTGTLRFDRLDLDAGLRVLSRAVPGERDRTEMGGPDVWSPRPIDFEVIAGSQIDVAVVADRFVITDGAPLQRTTFQFKFDGQSLALDDLKARTALNGAVAGAAKLMPQPGGFGLAGRFEIAKSELAALALSKSVNTGTEEDPVLVDVAPAEGQIEVSFDLEGRGGSLRSLIALARGTGRVRLRDVTLAGISPAAIRAAGDDFGVDAKIDAVTLNAVLRRELLARQVGLGDRELALRIRDGVVSVSPLRANVDGGRIENTTTIALATLAVDSRWRLVPSATADQGDVLPAVELIYSAPLAEIASATPVVRSDALARELVVRRLEGNVAELERLRRLDEERARRQAELRAKREREAAARRAAAERAARERLEAERARPGFGAEAVPGMTPDEGTVRRAPLPLPDRRSDYIDEYRNRTAVRTLALPEARVAAMPVARRRSASRSSPMRLGGAQRNGRRAKARPRTVTRSRMRARGWQQRALFSAER